MSPNLLRSHQIRNTADLHQNCTEVSIDKEISKRVNALVLMKGLGVTIGNDDANKTFKMNTTNENDIFDQHTSFLSRYSFCLNEEDKCLSHIYCLPNLYKNPAKKWFIIGAPKCSLKLVLSVEKKVKISHCVTIMSLQGQS